MSEVMLKVCTTYGHVLGGGEVDESEAVLVCSFMSTELTDYRSVFLLMAYLSVKVPDDDFDVVVRAAIVFTFQLLVKSILVVLSAS